MDNHRSVVVIPARYGSTRFPGKVLALLAGKPIVRWAYERAVLSGADEVLVATDDLRVARVVESFGGRVAMTSPDHPSGTDRVREAVQGLDVGIVINLQGDEPFVPPEVIARLIDIMKKDESLGMATVAVPRLRSEIEHQPNIVKVVFDERNRALYFSRSMIPFLRTGGTETSAYHHWGIYAFRRSVLDQFVSLPQGRLERCEMLEQLRALENGISIHVLVSDEKVVGIDTPDDLREAERIAAEQH
jgi:3-deoxy-manno-octulosonate cytidylyltransferase (CMP-KDO synthetase)